MARRTTRTILGATLVFIAVLGGFAWHYLAQRRSLPFPLIGEPVIGRRIDSMASNVPQPPDDAPKMYEWPVIGDAVMVAPDVAAELREILSSPSTYTFQDSDCFEPGMAVSFGDGTNRVDVLICLLCNKAIFYRGERRVGRHISEQGNKRLRSIYQRIFGAPASQF